MAHKAYSFNFLETVSRQLREELDGLAVTPLNIGTLSDLRRSQNKEDAKQGVYVVHMDGPPVYLGKAVDVAERLDEHREKITGRLNLDVSRCGYKALLLDKSMSTAANEDILIAMFRETHSGLWNGQGFGPKDPGRHRDTGRPSQFDLTYPINQDWLLDFSAIKGSEATAAKVLRTMKDQLPYLLRYKLTADTKNIPIDINSLPASARKALQAVVTTLGQGWQGVVLAHGMILYKSRTDYPYGDVLSP